MDSVVLDLAPEDLPNEHSGEVVNAISGISESSERQQLVSVSGIAVSPNVLVTTTSGNIFNGQDAMKSARIIIHNPTIDVLKNAHQTITFNHLNRSLSVPEKHNSFDPSVYESILPVRCRNIKGELHKSRFGSGNKGRSILVNGTWYTPSEFESLCGRGNSKDWKRSIRFGGRTLMCLIDQGVLRPHAASCTCSACCEDGSGGSGDGTPDPSNGPVRLFTPYKRKKRHHPKLKVSTNVQLPTSDNIGSAPAELPVSEISITGVPSESVTTLTVPILARDSVIPDSVIVAPEGKTLLSRNQPPNPVDINEQRQWWQLEESVKNAVRQILDLQKLIETAKNQSVASRESALQELRKQLENEKKEAVAACRLECQLTLSRALSEARGEREVAVRRAVEQSRVEMEDKINSMVAERREAAKRCGNCDRDAFSECTGCHRVSYCSPFCQKRDWESHKADCCGQEADCSEMVDDCSSSGS